MFLHNPRILLSISLLCLTYVSIFAEIPLTPASPLERFEYSVEMKQLKVSFESRMAQMYSRTLFVLCN